LGISTVVRFGEGEKCLHGGFEESFQVETSLELLFILRVVLLQFDKYSKAGMTTKATQLLSLMPVLATTAAAV
jgi:hypothetical protein